MNIAIINFSGNVGKSTIAKHLLAPRLQAPIIAIESINAGNENEEGAHYRFRGNEFDHFQATLMRQDRAIIDIGASNVEDFMRLMNQYVDSHGEFDLFVVPVVPEKKQQFDTVNTIESLKSLGIPPEKIVTVFNKVDVNQLENLESLFSIVFGFYHASQAFRCEKEAVIVNNDIFETIRHLNKSVDDIADDPTDYRARVRDTQDPDEKDNAIQMVLAQRLAKSAKRNLDQVYSTVMEGV